MVDNVYIFLAGMIFLFLVVVATYFLNITNKKNKVLKQKFMLGHWQREGTSPTSGEHWKFEYKIDKENIEMMGTNPTFKAKAKYKILKEEEHLLTLYIDKIQGDGDLDPHAISVAVDRNMEKIYIDSRLYRKVI